jgi:hypothetical protein
VRRADNLTTFMCRLSRNLGASNSWNPKGLSRPVMGLLYLAVFFMFFGTMCVNGHILDISSYLRYILIYRNLEFWYLAPFLVDYWCIGCIISLS